jgi:hypothetical protein
MKFEGKGNKLKIVWQYQSGKERARATDLRTVKKTSLKVILLIIGDSDISKSQLLITMSSADR